MKRFWDKVNKTPNCWVWMGSRNDHGYGKFNLGRVSGTRLAHRFSYEMVTGIKVPSGVQLLHLCDFPPCVRPDHLTPGTAKENMMDAARKGRLQRRLTILKVKEIKVFLANRISQTLLAREYGVHKSLISLIARRKSWVHA